MKPQPLLALFDAHALIHRAYHALPPLNVAKTGEPVSAVYGFASMFLKVLNELKPSHAAVAFDHPSPTFRHRESVEYKAQRPAAPSELISQFQRTRELVGAFGIPIYELEGYEADDLLGALSRRAESQGIDVAIVTGDMDTLQLVTPRVRVLTSRGHFSDTQTYDVKAVRERYGIEPAQMADLKGLKGDPSDNIPGVPGVGEKTAARLIQEFGSLEGIYQRIAEVKPPKLQDLLRRYEAQARQSKRLATIVTDLPLTLDLASCRLASYDRPKVLALFRALEFRTLLPKLPPAEQGAPQRGQLSLFPEERTTRIKVEAALAPECHLVQREEALIELLERLPQTRLYAVDLETTGKDALEAKLVGIALCLERGKAHYIPLGHHEGQQLPLNLTLERLKPLLEEPSIAKVAHNGKYDATVLAGYGIQLSNLAFDTMIAAYLLNDKALSLKDLAFHRLGIEMTPISALIGSGTKERSMAEVDILQVAQYSCADAEITLRLKELLEPELRQRDLWKLFQEVEMPLLPVLVTLERSGVLLDTALLRQMSQELGGQMQELELQIYNSVGHQFNINSTQQLGSVLFQELRLPSAKRTKTGYSTDAAVLEELRGTHPIIELLLEYRQLTKLKSTYVDALPSLINPRTGRLHTSFNQTVTATGRLSSSDPNLQNIPIRTDLGRRVRQAFIAEEGCLLLGADYSQIELRILAHLSQDPGLLAAFAADEDIHAATAAQVFGVPLEAVNPEMRRVAKVVNFGVIYGLSDYGLSQATRLSRQEAAQFINTYFQRYQGIRGYLSTTKEEAASLGYVQTLLGRRRYIPEINSSNIQTRLAAERMAVNMPVQGTAADIMKLAMIQVQQAMDRGGLHSKMILQVHDELLFEVPQEEITTIKELVQSIMPHAFPLCIPLKVDLKLGRNWGELE